MFYNELPAEDLYDREIVQERKIEEASGEIIGYIEDFLNEELILDPNTLTRRVLTIDDCLMNLQNVILSIKAELDHESAVANGRREPDAPTWEAWS